MPKVTLSQFSFNRGELDPALHGRSDWKYYYSGAEVLRNLITRTQGGATKRGGLRFVARTLHDDKPSRLVPFRFSVKQSYILEFGDFRLRVLMDGGVVVYPDGHAKAGQEVVIDTPYPVEALPRLRFAQTADVMILAHADYPPRRLSRHDHHDWRLDRLLTNLRTDTPECLRITDSGGDGSRYLVTALSASAGESAASEIVVATNPNGETVPGGSMKTSELYHWLRERNSSYIPEQYNFAAMERDELTNFMEGCGYQTVDRVHNGPVYWWYFIRPGTTGKAVVEWTVPDLTPLVNEALAACDNGYAGTVRNSYLAAVEKYVKDYNASLPGSGTTVLAWDAVPDANEYRIYRSRVDGGPATFRLIGKAVDTVFTDTNLANQSTGLPDTDDFFSGVDDYPGVCAFFEQRLVLGRTNNKPTTFWGSDTGIYNSFTRHSPIIETDSYEFTLASGEMNEIHWIVPLNDMLLGTSGGEWKAGGGGGAITPLNINARVQSWYGCSPAAPVVTGRTVVFAGRGKRTLRSFSYSLEADGYSGRDLTAYAAHLFVGREIVAMCHQQEPAGILWVVMSDGALLSCTYSPEEDVVSWSRHDTAGRFESCGALVDMDGTDQVYFSVAREIDGVTRRFIESLEDPADTVTDPADAFFVDCGLTYVGQPTGQVWGLDHLEGEAVACLADGNVVEGLRVKGGGLALPDGMTAGVIHVGLPYTTSLVTLELEPEGDESLRNRARFAVAATIRLQATRECLYSHSDGYLAEMKFRTNEAPGRAVRLFTGEKSVTFTTPPGARTTRLRLDTVTPTPFTVLGIIAEAACGQPV